MRLLQNAAIFLIAIVLSLAVVEVGLRIHDGPRFAVTKTPVTLNGQTYNLVNTHSSLSARDRRVVFVGDSFVEGNKCGNEHNLPGTYASLVGEDVQVDNLGLGGYGPFDYLDVLTNYVEEVGPPHRAFAFYYFNDIELFPSACRYRSGMAESGIFNPADIDRMEAFCGQDRQQLDETRDRFGGSFDTFFRWSKTYLLLRESAARTLLALRPSTPVGRAHFIDLWERSDTLEHKMVLYSIQQLSTLATEWNSELIIGFYPNVESISKDSRLFGPYEEAATIAREAYGASAFNGYSVFLAHEDARPNMSISMLDTHPSCEAHGIMADFLAKSF